METVCERKQSVVVVGRGFQRETDEVRKVAEIGFFDGAGFQAQGQGVRVGGDGDGGDFEKLLFQIAAAGDRGRGRR